MLPPIQYNTTKTEFHVLYILKEAVTIKYRHCESSPDIMALQSATAAPALALSGTHIN